MKQNVFLILIILLAIGLPLFFQYHKEGFSKYTLDSTFGIYPESEEKVLVQDFYPRIKGNSLSNYTASKMWWHRPTFEVGSYDQITNNIRYSNNPDVGSCSPASICGALYHENQLASNYTSILPLVPEIKNDVRINYYNTSCNLFPFSTNVTNVEY
jgi:hypothetical protein